MGKAYARRTVKLSRTVELKFALENGRRPTRRRRPRELSRWGGGNRIAISAYRRHAKNIILRANELEKQNKTEISPKL